MMIRQNIFGTQLLVLSSTDNQKKQSALPTCDCFIALVYINACEASNVIGGGFFSCPIGKELECMSANANQ